MHALQMLDISKQFGNVQALKGITFNVAPKQIHALCGENGAGKSTLMKVLSGVYAHGTYSGKIIWNGTEARFKNLTQSENAGIAIIAQELALVPEMSIAENIFLGREICKNGILQKQKMLSDSNVLLKSLGLNVSAQTKVKDCGIGLQQMIEIAKALSKNARLLILDEPTAALTETESETLLQLLVSLCKNGLTAIIISHKLKEVLQVANQITILRDGETVGTFEANQMDEAQLIKHMVGRQLSDLYNKQNRIQGKLMLEVNELCTWGATNKKQIIISASLQVHSHQIIGLAGLMGAGRTELVEALFGAWKGKVTGNVFINGFEGIPQSPNDAIQKGLVLVSEDRKRYGLVLQQNISNNTTLAALKLFCKNLLINHSQVKNATSKSVAELKIKVNSIKQQVQNLSGGNQQKVVLAKWLLTKPAILILDEPTRGIDIGAKAEIYTLIQNLASQGAAILMVSSELPELMGLCDKIYVMNKGKINGCFNSSVSAETIMHAATEI